ncbi:MAG: hypothetical protein Q4E34_00340, partial [Synergistaceae bacterium]|nr:hypothetical protein [Synergistaceae bacterium]
NRRKLEMTEEAISKFASKVTQQIKFDIEEAQISLNYVETRLHDYHEELAKDVSKKDYYEVSRSLGSCNDYRIQKAELEGRIKALKLTLQHIEGLL